MLDTIIVPPRPIVQIANLQRQATENEPHKGKPSRIHFHVLVLETNSIKLSQDANHSSARVSPKESEDTRIVDKGPQKQGNTTEARASSIRQYELISTDHLL